MRGTCIECRQPKDAHQADGHCPWKHNTKYSTMDLPDGAHCSDCIHIRFCSDFIGNVSENTHCDWFPIRFAWRKPAVEPTGITEPVKPQGQGIAKG